MSELLPPSEQEREQRRREIAERAAMRPWSNSRDAREFSGTAWGSPLGQFVTRVLTPRLPFRAKYVAGPPKRFAQGIGASLSVAAALLHLGFGATGAAYILVGLIMVAAALESVLGLCLGCTIFGILMRAGVVPRSVCERCNNIWAHAAER